jgi:plastocyanin
VIGLQFSSWSRPILRSLNATWKRPLPRSEFPIQIFFTHRVEFRLPMAKHNGSNATFSWIFCFHCIFAQKESSLSNMTYIVEIRNHAFNPRELHIKIGDVVKWVNRDATRHSATRTAAPAFDTGPLSRDMESAAVIFTEPSGAEGNEYSCDPHPDMVGTIVVA